MKLIALTIVAAALLTGCNAPSDGADSALALGALGPGTVDAQDTARPRMFFLGAGDALGEQTFAYYVASLELDGARYATEPTDY
jgi:hypothetical protein